MGPPVLGGRRATQFTFDFTTPDGTQFDRAFFRVDNIDKLESSTDEAGPFTWSLRNGQTIAFGVYSQDNDGSEGSVTISNFQFTPTADVPAPLPLLGAGAAFGWSRRLRRRIRTQAGVAVR